MLAEDAAATPRAEPALQRLAPQRWQVGQREARRPVDLARAVAQGRRLASPAATRLAASVREEALTLAPQTAVLPDRALCSARCRSL